MRPIDRLITNSVEAVDAKLAAKIEAAESALASGYALRAESMVRSLLANYPRSARLHSLMGRIKRGRRATAQALPCFRKAFALEPAHFDYLMDLAACLLESGELEEALRMYERAHAIHPTNASVQFHLAHLAEALGGAPPPAAAPGAASTPEVPAAAAPVAATSTPARASASEAKPSGLSPAGGSPKGTNVFLALHGDAFNTGRPRPAAETEEDIAAAGKAVDIRSAEFWEMYNRYNVTRTVELSEAEKSGDVHLGSQDFHAMQEQAFADERRAKFDTPILDEDGAGFRAAIFWAWGLRYVGHPMGILRVLVNLSLVFTIAMGVLICQADLEFEKRLPDLMGAERYAAWEMEYAEEGKEFIPCAQRTVATGAAATAIGAFLIFCALERRMIRLCAQEARRRNLGGGLVLEVGKDFTLRVNLGARHGLVPGMELQVLKRQFHVEYDDLAKESHLVSAFRHIGRAELSKIEEMEATAAFYPDRGQVVIPKVGDRMAVHA